MLEHLNNAYSRRSESFGGANPFLCHPDEVKYRQYGALVKDTLADKELVHAGTPYEVDLEKHEAKFMKVWEVVKVETESTNTVLTLNASWLAPELAATDVVMVVPAYINGYGKGVVAGTVTDNGDGTISITVATADIDAVAAGDFISIADKAEVPAPAGYYDSTSGTQGALKVVASGATTGQINLDDVTPYYGSKSPLAANDYVIFQEEVLGASLKVKGNGVLTRDLRAGNAQNFVDVARGEVYCYVNTVNGIPAAVIAAAREIGQFIEPEYFAEVPAES